MKSVLTPTQFPSLEAITVKNFLYITPEIVHAFTDIHIDGVSIQW